MDEVTRLTLEQEEESAFIERLREIILNLNDMGEGGLADSVRERIASRLDHMSVRDAQLEALGANRAPVPF